MDTTLVIDYKLIFSRDIYIKVIYAYSSMGTYT
jgi:hypothetical protein